MKSIQEQIERMKKIRNSIIVYINIEEMFKNLVEQITEFKILNDKHDLKAFLYLSSIILSNHYRIPNFFFKMMNIGQNDED